jgi:hypothetical protein
MPLEREYIVIGFNRKQSIPLIYIIILTMAIDIIL